MNELIRDLEPWFAASLKVKKSRIHGLGTFACEPFFKGDEIFRLGGFLFLLPERNSAAVMASTSVPLSEEVLLAESASGNKDASDFLNHSCEPNLGFKDSISLVAIRDIAKGEELVIDYAFWECDPAWKLKTSCNCGSTTCRGSVTGRDWQSLTPSSEYSPYFSPFLKRRILCTVGLGGMRS